MHKDTIVGIAGAAILIAAMAGVFWYEGTRGAESAGAREFAVVFAAADGNGPSKAGTATVGTPVADKLTLVSGNFTKITFTLLWTDDAGAPDSFKIRIEPPNATGLAAQETEAEPNEANGKGEIKVEFNLGNLPGATSLFADSAQEAEATAMGNSARRVGGGEWRFTVTLTAAGDPTPVALPGGLPVNPVDDASNAWEVKTILTSFAADAS